jgi:hypothetical protein
MTDRIKVMIIVLLALFFACIFFNYPKHSKLNSPSNYSGQAGSANNYPAPSIWSVRYYVDEFGDPTSRSYIYSGKISGVFSNSATTNSRLIADILIDRSDKISFQLYEYGGNHPIKGYHPDGEYFDFFIKDDQGLKSAFIGILDQGSDRIRFNLPDDAKKFHKTLLNNNEIKVFIQNDDTPTSKYSFTIHAIGYKEIYKEFSGSK